MTSTHRYTLKHTKVAFSFSFVFTLAQTLFSISSFHQAVWFLMISVVHITAEIRPTVFWIRFESESCTPLVTHLVFVFAVVVVLFCLVRFSCWWAPGWIAWLLLDYLLCICWRFHTRDCDDKAVDISSCVWDIKMTSQSIRPITFV